VSTELESKRQSLNRIYDKLEKLERDEGNVELLRQYRARARQLADEITELERDEDA